MSHYLYVWEDGSSTQTTKQPDEADVTAVLDGIQDVFKCGEDGIFLLVGRGKWEPVKPRFKEDEKHGT